VKCERWKALAQIIYWCVWKIVFPALLVYHHDLHKKWGIPISYFQTPVFPSRNLNDQQIASLVSPAAAAERHLPTAWVRNGVPMGSQWEYVRIFSVKPSNLGPEILTNTHRATKSRKWKTLYILWIYGQIHGKYMDYTNNRVRKTCDLPQEMSNTMITPIKTGISWYFNKNTGKTNKDQLGTNWASQHLRSTWCPWWNLAMLQPSSNYPKNRTMVSGSAMVCHDLSICSCSKSAAPVGCGETGAAATPPRFQALEMERNSRGRTKRMVLN
jgi:hypothetical protein